ncbi:hypothetical protein [Methylobacter psychrophilus]|nr:hypothetical protein [Methylobacter psychrophilus]
MDNKITGYDLQLMTGYWLKSLVNGYLGSKYGSDTKSILQLPQSDLSADE